jgi:hypothetical protein
MDSSIVQEVRSLLLLRDNGTLIDLCEKDRRFWKALRLNLNEGDEVLRHQAIEAVAGLMQRWWQSGRQESVRDYMRRLIWSMTDESGEIGWSAPETMAEIIVHIPELLEPYGSIMIARAFEEPPLVKGGLWGIGRLGKRIGQVIELHQNEILAAFDSDDPEIIGLAAWAMGEAGFAPALPHLKSLQSRKESVQLYIEGDFVEQPLKNWVHEAISKIETGPTADSR